MQSKAFTEKITNVAIVKASSGLKLWSNVGRQALVAQHTIQNHFPLSIITIVIPQFSSAVMGAIAEGSFILSIAIEDEMYVNRGFLNFLYQRSTLYTELK